MLDWGETLRSGLLIVFEVKIVQPLVCGFDWTLFIQRKYSKLKCVAVPHSYSVVTLCTHHSLAFPYCREREKKSRGQQAEVSVW